MPTTDTDLYRAIIKGTFEGDVLVKDDKPVAGVLYPRFEQGTYFDRHGIEKTSDVDLTVNGEHVEADGGTSMHDVRGWFGYSEWGYFYVPQGTDYPESLFIRRGKRVQKNRPGTLTGRHYQIEPKNRMTVQAYKGALDNFARNAVVRQIQLARTT